MAEDLQVSVELVEGPQVAILVLHRAEVERLWQPAHGRDALFCEVPLCRVVEHVMHIFPELQPRPLLLLLEFACLGSSVVTVASLKA